MNVTDRKSAMVLMSENASLKRIAWAFGCAKKDSAEETALCALLIERIEQMLKKRRGE
jgi:hypothetical protein